MGALAAVPGLLVAKDFLDEQQVKQEDEQERELAVDFKERFETGISDNWLAGVVWPGLAIIPPSVELFSTPTLYKTTQVQWSEEKTREHLAVQRPFMAHGTAAMNQVGMPDVLQAVGPEVLGFWLPNSDEMVFCDRAEYSDQILLPTNSTAGIYYDNRRVIGGESITLEPAVRRDSLTWRYLENQLAVGGARPETLTKVCGRSTWAGIDQVSEAYYDFDTRHGNDLIQLPAA
jgi:hypothetical protein